MGCGPFLVSGVNPTACDVSVNQQKPRDRSGCLTLTPDTGAWAMCFFTLSTRNPRHHYYLTQIPDNRSYKIVSSKSLNTTKYGVCLSNACDEGKGKKRGVKR